MKEYRYKSKAGNMIGSVIMLLILLAFAGRVFSSANTHAIMFYSIVVIAVFIGAVRTGYIFWETNSNHHKVIVKDDRIQIPDIYNAGHHTFHYESVTQLEVQKHYTFQYYRYIGTIIYIAAEKNGKTRKGEIYKAMLKSETDFYEILDEIKSKVNVEVVHKEKLK